MKSFMVDGYEVKTEFNPNKVSTYHKEKIIIIDPTYANNDLTIVLYMIYATLAQRTNKNLINADRFAFERLKNEGHKLTAKFYATIIEIISVRNYERKKAIVDYATIKPKTK